MYDGIVSDHCITEKERNSAGILRVEKLKCCSVNKPNWVSDI